MLLRRLVYVLCALFMLLPALAPAQKQMTPAEEAAYRDMLKRSGMDPDAMMEAMKTTNSTRKWADAKAVHYHIVGVYAGRTIISSQPGEGFAYADVTDRVVINLDWKLTEAKLVGAPSVQNTKSTLKNLRDPVDGCKPPAIKGEYEHYEVLGVKEGLSGMIELQVQTSIPLTMVAQACVGSHKSILAARNTRPESMVLPPPTLLDQKDTGSSEYKFSPDKKSIVMQKGGWTWTYTPTIAARK